MKRGVIWYLLLVFIIFAMPACVVPALLTQSGVPQKEGIKITCQYDSFSLEQLRNARINLYVGHNIEVKGYTKSFAYRYGEAKYFAEDYADTLFTHFEFYLPHVSLDIGDINEFDYLLKSIYLSQDDLEYKEDIIADIDADFVFIINKVTIAKLTSYNFSGGMGGSSTECMLTAYIEIWNVAGQGIDIEFTSTAWSDSPLTDFNASSTIQKLASKSIDHIVYFLGGYKEANTN